MYPVAKDLYDSVMLDIWPGPAAICDFGIDSQRHYEALFYPIRNEEISLRKLSAILGNGPLITDTVRKCKANPHKDIVFTTVYENLGPEDE